eukprot:8533279-Karenia_brevis.AAC.1
MGILGCAAPVSGVILSADGHSAEHPGIAWGTAPYPCDALGKLATTLWAFSKRPCVNNIFR